ncbi:MAG: HAD family phosphatase [Leifsonia flava]
MAIRIPDRVVVFDYGEVLSRPPSAEDRAAVEHAAGVDADPFWPAYWRHRDALDHGRLSTHEYWKRVGDDLGTDWSDSHIHRLWISDYRSWLSIDQDVFDIVAELHDGGTRVALLSNAAAEYGGYLRGGPMARFVERVFVSAEMGKLKPSPDIYLEVAANLGVAPAQLIFIDNNPANVEGAEALGITGHVFTDAARLRTFLTTCADQE